MAPLVAPALGWAGSAIGNLISDDQKKAAAEKAAAQANSPQAAAEQQATSAQNSLNTQTQTNRPNQNNAFGFTNWTTGPDGRPVQTSGFAPGMQNTFNSLQQQAQQANATPMDDGSAARDQAINAAYGQSRSRLDPMWNQQQEQLGSSLANQGLDAGSEAARNANADFSRNRNDAYQGAMNSAIGQGTAAQQATFNENMAARNNPMQQMLAMQGGANNMPGFNAAGNAGPTNYYGAWQDQNAIQQAGLQRASDQMNAAMGAGAQAFGALAGAAGKASDARVKHDIHRLPVDAIPGVPLATFSYNATPKQRHVGVIAQDLEKVAPEHVKEGPDGVKRVSPQFAPFAFKKR